jgi:hypothetical protein
VDTDTILEAIKTGNYITALTIALRIKEEKLLLLCQSCRVSLFYRYAKRFTGFQMIYNRTYLTLFSAMLSMGKLKFNIYYFGSVHFLLEENRPIYHRLHT